MLPRTAKKGKSAGKEFWGCSTFPGCRGTRAFDEAAEANPTQPGEPAKLDSPNPLPFYANPIASHLQADFFQSVALPSRLVEAINYFEVDRDSDSYGELTDCS